MVATPPSPQTLSPIDKASSPIRRSIRLISQGDGGSGDDERKVDENNPNNQSSDNLNTPPARQRPPPKDDSSSSKRRSDRLVSQGGSGNGDDERKVDENNEDDNEDNRKFNVCKDSKDMIREKSDDGITNPPSRQSSEDGDSDGGKTSTVFPNQFLQQKNLFPVANSNEKVSLKCLYLFVGLNILFLVDKKFLNLFVGFIC